MLTLEFEVEKQEKFFFQDGTEMQDIANWISSNLELLDLNEAHSCSVKVSDEVGYEDFIHIGGDEDFISVRVVKIIPIVIQDGTESKPFLVKDSEYKGLKFCRKDSKTGKGMNEGFCFGDGEEYFANREDAEEYAISLGYDSLEDAYDGSAYYYTEWEIECECEETWFDEEGNCYLKIK